MTKCDRPEIKRITLKGGDILWTHSKGPADQRHHSNANRQITGVAEAFPAPSDFTQGRYNCRGEYVIPEGR